MRTQSDFRLLVVRLGAMGDILHALPAVTALRQAHPEWVIDWVVEPRWRPLLAAEGSAGLGPAQPLVDRLYLAPAKEWGRAPLSLRTIREIKDLRLALRAGGYDSALDLQGAVRSALVGRLANCRRLIGEAEPREPVARWLFTERVATRGVHVVEQDVELASAVAGDELAPASPWLPVDVAAETWADDVLSRGASRPGSPQTGGEGAGPGPWGGDQAVLLSPGAGWGAKRWPAEGYAAVAKGLIDRGLRVLVNAGPGEEPLAAAIVQGTLGAATPLACSLGQLIALTRRVALCIGGDTGPLHLACALGRPVVGIFGPTDPNRNGPFGSRFRVLRSPESRRDHARRAAPEAGLLTIQPEEVLRAADELLAEEETAP